MEWLVGKILKFMDFGDDILLPLKNSSFGALLLISWLIYFSPKYCSFEAK